MKVADVQRKINDFLAAYNVTVFFTEKSLNDLNSYEKDIQEKIIALILKRARAGPLLKPKGIGDSLAGKLKGYAKIKSNHLGIRIIYRPIDNVNIIRMEIIAIGPRNKKEVYRTATKRLLKP